MLFTYLPYIILFASTTEMARPNIKQRYSILLLVLGCIICAMQLPPKCGKWRWDVKTITDHAGLALLDRKPVRSSVDELVVQKPPKVLYSSDQSDGRETRMASENEVVEIIAWVTKVKHESDDSDLHFILPSQGSGNTMIGEIPDPDCTTFDAFPALRNHFIKTRQDGFKVWDFWRNAKRPVKVRITGVPFWDGIHPGSKPKGSSQ